MNLKSRIDKIEERLKPKPRREILVIWQDLEDPNIYICNGDRGTLEEVKARMHFAQYAITNCTILVKYGAQPTGIDLSRI